MHHNRRFLDNTVASFLAACEDQEIILLGTDNWAKKAITELIVPYGLSVEYCVSDMFGVHERNFMEYTVKDISVFLEEENTDRHIVLICGNKPYYYMDLLEEKGFLNYYSFYLFVEFFIHVESRVIEFSLGRI